MFFLFLFFSLGTIFLNFTLFTIWVLVNIACLFALTLLGEQYTDYNELYEVDAIIVAKYRIIGCFNDTNAQKNEVKCVKELQFHSVFFKLYF